MKVIVYKVTISQSYLDSKELHMLKNIEITQFKQDERIIAAI